MVIGWLIFSIVVGYIAKNKGYQFFDYFLLSIFLSPLIGLILILTKKDNTQAIELKSGKLKNCLYCAEPINREATKCKHCGADLPVLR